MRFYINSVVSLFCGLLLSSCSVYMASQNQGTDVSVIEKCGTRTCLQNKGAVLISQKSNKQDVVTEEIYQVQKPTGSAARALMHGALDVATFGVWEVAGTPMEGVINKPDKYGIRVLYKPNGEDIKTMQLVA